MNDVTRASAIQQAQQQEAVKTQSRTPTITSFNSNITLLSSQNGT